MKLQKLAELLYRKASDEPLTAPSRRRDLFAHYILFGLLFGSVMLGYAAIMALQLADPIVKNIQVGPQLLFAANALFAALVFGFWLAQRQRHEYFYIATYATVCSLMRLRNLDVFRMEIPPQDLILFDTFLQSAEGGFGLLMALTFARSRLDLIRWGLPLLVGLPPILHWTLRLLGLPLPLHSILDGVYAPLLLALGAASCLIQAGYLHQSGLSITNPNRARRLGIFALLLLTLGAAARAPADLPGLNALKLLLLIISAWISLTEYGEKNAL